MKAKGAGLGSGHSALVGRDQPTLISPPERVGNRNFASCLLPWGSALRGQWEKSSWGLPAAGQGICWGEKGLRQDALPGLPASQFP